MNRDRLITVRPVGFVWQALLTEAKNRFGDKNFPGGSAQSRQAVLTGNFYGATNSTANGPAPELGYAAGVYAGTTSVTLPAGAKCYWSPTNTQFTVIQKAYSTGATTEPGATEHRDAGWGQTCLLTICGKLCTKRRLQIILETGVGIPRLQPLCSCN